MAVVAHVYGDSAPYQVRIENATDEHDGTMSKEDKEKLDGIPDGGAGVNAFTTTTAGFVQPSATGTVTVNVANSAWIAFGQIVYVENGGYYQAAAQGPTQVVLNNLGYAGNADAGATIASGSQVSPAGLRGSSEIRLQCIAENLPPDSVARLEPSGIYPGIGVVAPFLVNSTIRISRYRLAIGSGTADSNTNTYSIRYSSNQGTSYTTVEIATLAAGSKSGSGTFTPITLQPGDFVYVQLNRSAGGGNFSASFLINLS